MTACDFCGDTIDAYAPYDCNFCNLELCSGCRLPENHHCSGLRAGEETFGDSKPETTAGSGHVEGNPGTDYETYGGARDPDVVSSPDLNPDGSLQNQTDHEGDQEDHTRRVDRFKRGVEKKWRWITGAVRNLIRTVWRLTVRAIKLTVIAAVVLGLLWIPLSGALAITDDGVVQFDPAELEPGSGSTVSGIVNTSDTTATVPEGSAEGSFAQTATSTAVTTSAQTAASTQTTAETRTQAPAGTDRLDRTEIERWIHHYVNVERSDRGRTNLSRDSGLREIARYHSRDMIENGYFAHESPDGETMENRYEQFDYECRVFISETEYVTGGENIAQTHAFVRVRTSEGIEYYSTEREVGAAIVRDWMHSEGHRENILRSYWENEGIGVVLTDGPEDGIVVSATQNFC